MALTPSQRVTLLKEIGTRLQDEEWPFIDVVLPQFGLPTSSWNGNKLPYVLAMCKEASDSTLVDLAQHFGFQLESTTNLAPLTTPPFWHEKRLRVFLSHLSSRKSAAAALQQSLLSYGICSFVAHNDIEPTLEWQEQIELALATADSLVALLHPGFAESNWTDQEVGFAMGRGIPVLSVGFGHAPYGFIGKFQAFKGNSKSSDALAKELFETFRNNKQTQRRMSEALLDLFENSNTFVAAKERIGYLEELEVWEPSYVPRIRAAAKSNSQIVGSWGVPGRVTALAKKWAGI